MEFQGTRLSMETRQICRVLFKAAAVSAALSIASICHALSFTPAGICSDAGFPKGHEFRQTCVDRVFSERRSRAWREQAPAAMMGAVAGIAAATGGTAFGYISVPGQTNLRQVDLEGQSFIVHVPSTAIANVVSAQRYKNIPQAEIDLWVRAAAQGTGCPVTRYVRDFDALYVWTDCSKPAPAAAVQSVSAPEALLAPAAASTTMVQPSIVDELAKLASMRQKGLLSPDEFSAAKAKLLGQHPN